MIWLAYILGYIVAPFIVFPINDYLSGYYKDRLDDLPSILHNVEKDTTAIVLSFTFWPLVTVVFICIWAYSLLEVIFKKVKIAKELKQFLSSIEDRGAARRQREQDLDYQAEKYLLDKK